MTKANKTPEVKSDIKITEEVAEMEFENFVDEMDLDVCTDEMDENDKVDFQKFKRTIIRAIMRGDLVFDEAHQPVFTPTHKNSENIGPIKFYEPDGSNFMEMDRKKTGHDIGKMHALMAGITKKPAKVFSGLKNRDYKVCSAIVTLFLG